LPVGWLRSVSGFHACGRSAPWRRVPGRTRRTPSGVRPAIAGGLPRPCWLAGRPTALTTRTPIGWISSGSDPSDSGSGAL